MRMLGQRVGLQRTQTPAFRAVQVFSHFCYRDTCTGEERLAPIEPLVGVLRNPSVCIECRRRDHPEYIDKAHDLPTGHIIENKGCGTFYTHAVSQSNRDTSKDSNCHVQLSTSSRPLQTTPADTW